jgi:hypothetical protein
LPSVKTGRNRIANVDIDFDDDPDLKEWQEHRKARARTDELMKVAVALVASDRATVAEAARLAGCSRQRLHEACRSYADFSRRRDAMFKHAGMAVSDRMMEQRWDRFAFEAKPMPHDLSAARRLSRPAMDARARQP